MVSYKALFLAVAATVAVAQNPHVVDGAKEAMINHQQVIDTLNRQMASNPSHSTADRMVAALTGADSQIDNAIATVSQALAPFTGGASLAIAGTLLGPFAQSVTNGAEVMVANLVGGAIDRTQGAFLGNARTYTNNLVRFRTYAASYGVNTKRLDSAISRLHVALH